MKRQRPNLAYWILLWVCGITAGIFIVQTPFIRAMLIAVGLFYILATLWQIVRLRQMRHRAKQPLYPPK